MSGEVQESQMDGKQDTSIEVAGNATFDDFDRMESAREDFKEAKVIKDVDGEHEKVAAKKEPKEERKDVVDNKKEEKKEAAEAQRKMMKLLDADKELEVPEDAMVQVKINGKYESVKLSDLGKDFSGKTDWNKKYTDLDKERRLFVKGRSQVESMVMKFNELAKSDDIFAPLTYLIDTGKGDSYAYIERMRNHFQREFEESMNLSDAEKTALSYKRKLDFLESKSKSQEIQGQQENVKRQDQARIEKLLSDHKIDDNEFERVSEQLKKNTNQDWKPENVVEYMTKYVPASHVEQAVLQKFSDKIEITDKIKDQVWDIALANPEFSPDDIIEILEPFLKSQNKKSKSSVLGEKLGSSASKVVPKQTNYESFDDYNDN